MAPAPGQPTVACILHCALCTTRRVSDAACTGSSLDPRAVKVTDTENGTQPGKRDDTGTAIDNVEQNGQSMEPERVDPERDVDPRAWNGIPMFLVPTCPHPGQDASVMENCVERTKAWNG